MNYAKIRSLLLIIQVGKRSLLQRIFPTRGSNPGLLHCRQILCQLSHKGSPRLLEWVAFPFSRGSSWLRNQTGVPCIAGRFFTNWAIREACNSRATLKIKWTNTAKVFWVNVSKQTPLLCSSQSWISSCVSKYSVIIVRKSWKIPCSPNSWYSTGTQHHSLPPFYQSRHMLREILIKWEKNQWMV